MVLEQVLTRLQEASSTAEQRAAALEAKKRDWIGEMTRKLSELEAS
jgi:hypothetical protein